MNSTNDEKLSARELLLAFNEIQQRGNQRDGGYVLGSLRGEVGHDGYTVTISDELVDVTVGFHNSISVQAASKQALQQFRERIDSLNAATR